MSDVTGQQSGKGAGRQPGKGSEPLLKTGDRLVVASHNEGKVREIRDLLEPFGIETVSAAELDLPEPEETGTTFAANALIKAESAANEAGIAALADDSGLEVEALGGEPGIFSARWGGEEKDFDLAMTRVHEALEEKGAASPAERRANFICALCLALPGGERGMSDHRIFEGRVFGHINWPPRGDRGFGYDPIFTPDGHDLTFAEMEPQAKHDMSHRAAAFKLFVESCFENNGNA